MDAAIESLQSSAELLLTPGEVGDVLWFENRGDAQGPMVCIGFEHHENRPRPSNLRGRKIKNMTLKYPNPTVFTSLENDFFCLEWPYIGTSSILK